MKKKVENTIKHAVILIALISMLPVNGQNSPAKIKQGYGEDEKELLKTRWDMALGTFQFQITNSRINPQVDINIIDEIEKNRDENQVVYINYTENIKIMILSKSTINHPFEKLSLFKYISTTN